MMQIVEQTHDETVAMYMKGCTKNELAEMLTNCNAVLRTMSKAVQWTEVARFDAETPSPE